MTKNNGRVEWNRAKTLHSQYINFGMKAMHLIRMKENYEKQYLVSPFGHSICETGKEIMLENFAMHVSVMLVLHKLIDFHYYQSARSPWPGECNFNTKPISRLFHRPVYF